MDYRSLATHEDPHGRSTGEDLDVSRDAGRELEIETQEGDAPATCRGDNSSPLPTSRAPRNPQDEARGRWEPKQWWQRHLENTTIEAIRAEDNAVVLEEGRELGLIR